MGRTGVFVPDFSDHGGSRISSQARRSRIRLLRLCRRGDQGGGDGTNALIFPALRRMLAKAPPAQREVRAGDGLLDLGGAVSHQSLGTIRRLLDDDTTRQPLRTALPHDWRWLEGELPAQLEPVRDLRNPAAHDRAVAREEMGRLRQSVLGIGCEGLLVRIVRAKLRSRS